MKQSIISRIFVCYGGLLFLFFWFANEIMELMTPFFMIVPMILILISVVCMLIWALVYFLKNRKAPANRPVRPLVILLMMFVIIGIFPFFPIKLQLEHWIYKNQRYEIVQQIARGELFGDTGKRVISLPKGSRHLSFSGKIVVYESNGSDAMVGFFITRGLLTPHYELIYSANGVPNRSAISSLASSFDLEIQPYDESWYLVSFP
ncbi:MAG: hypothetical protein RR185_00225 [Angelakisella sp.]